MDLPRCCRVANLGVLSAAVPIGVAAWCLEWVKPEGWEEFGVPVGGDAHCPFAVVDDSVVVAA